MPPKLMVCDRCGFELTDKDYIQKIFDGTEAWWEAVKARGEEPRGFFPCKNYRNCHGEMIIPGSKQKLHKGGNSD